MTSSFLSVADLTKCDCGRVTVCAVLWPRPLPKPPKKLTADWVRSACLGYGLVAGRDDQSKTELAAKAGTRAHEHAQVRGHCVTAVALSEEPLPTQGASQLAAAWFSALCPLHDH